MPRTRMYRTVLGAVFLALLSSCVESDGVTPAAELTPTPDLAVFDATTGYSESAYFLPPLADKNPSVTGDFNPNLLPSMRVCEISLMELGDPAVTCDGRALHVDVPAGSFVLDAVGEQYAYSWDTDGPETTGPIDTNEFQRLEVLLGTEILMAMDLDPQDPQGPGQSNFDAYPYRVGEVLPAKIWLGEEVLCIPLPYVTECITGAVVTQQGATLVLDDEGARLVTDIFANTINFPAGWTEEFIIVQLERIPRLSYLAEFGEECVPIDGPLVGEDCFRISTIPDDVTFSGQGSLVSICLPPSAFTGLTAAEIAELTMFSADGDPPTVTQLADAAGNCPTQTASLVDVPESGLLRYAAMGVNAVASVVLPTPVVARDLEFGALKSSYSIHAYARPFELQVTAGDGTVIQASDGNEVEVTFTAVDRASLSVAGATLHLSSDDGTINGASVDVDVTTDASGQATVTWAVDRTDSGTKQLLATVVGGSGDPVEPHSSTFVVTPQQVTVSAIVVGEPSILSPTPSSTIPDAVAGEPETISVLVTDEDGNPVSGVQVSWSCTESCIIPTSSTTGPDGIATVQWTPLTAGSMLQATAGVNTLTTTFTATVAPAAPASLSPTQSATEGLVGSNIVLGITVQDAYSNVISSLPVSWNVTGGGGTFASSDASTAAGGTAGATWTLGSTPGTNTASVSAGGLSHTFSVTATCFNGWGTANVNGAFAPGEWACANSRTFEANISGGKTPATVYWMNDGANLYMAVRLQQSSSAKVNDLRIDFDNNGDNVAAVNDDAIGHVSGAFIDEHLTQRCFDRSQAGCGGKDAVTNGSSAVGNNGTFTTFELSHPLSGDGSPQDFIRSAATGQNNVGFFVSLQQGNGAQGNTQWPGFRLYEIITIVGLPTP